MTMDTPKDAPPTASHGQGESAYYDGSRSLASVLDELAIPRGRPVLVVVGSADRERSEEIQDAQRLLIEAVVAPVCRDEGAVVVSGGTDSGVMAVLGRAMREHAPDTVLVGVAPNGRLRGYGAGSNEVGAAWPEPHHRLIRVAGETWGSEGPTLVRVAERIVGRSGVVVLALGGGDGTSREIALAARRRWPVILMTGCGGASENLARALPPATRPTRRSGADSGLGESLSYDDDVRTAAEDGRFVALKLGERAEVERVLRWRLSNNALLREAWTRFSTTDVFATTRKQPTQRLARGVLLLAMATVLCAVLLGLSRAPSGSGKALISAAGGDVLKGAVTALPLVAAALLGLVERRSRAGTWIELRYAAEYILREIYRSRAGAGNYGSHQTAPALLSQALVHVDTKTEGRSAALSNGYRSASLWPPPSLAVRISSADSLLGPLAASVYDEARVVDQLSFLETSVQRAERHATRLAMTIFLIGGSSAFLLAISWRWADVAAGAAAAAGLVAALVAWREYSQREARTDAMRTTCLALRSARGRWLALPFDERHTSSQMTAYVTEVEDALAAEASDWERSLRQAQQGLLTRYKTG